MIYPSIGELTKDGKINRYELVIATAKCARKITDEYVAPVSYTHLDVYKRQGEQMRLRCSDTIVSCREGDGCRITLNRRVSFEPEHLFYLSVSVGTRFRFDMRYYEEVDWSREDVAGAFRESNSPALTDMMARCSLLIAQITSATGHTPFVTPATPEDAAAKSGNP